MRSIDDVLNMSLFSFSLPLLAIAPPLNPEHMPTLFAPSKRIWLLCLCYHISLICRPLQFLPTVWIHSNTWKQMNSIIMQKQKVKTGEAWEWCYYQCNHIAMQKLSYTVKLSSCSVIELQLDYFRRTCECHIYVTVHYILVITKLGRYQVAR